MSGRALEVPGFRAAGVACGIKSSGRDLALLVSDVPASVAGVFTRSSVVGAPVELSRARVRSGRARAVVVNSGVANVAMGARGLRDARAMAGEAARVLGVDAEGVLIASTGVIGRPIPMGRVRAGIRAAAAALAPDGLGDAARAIMTTDTIPKTAVLSTRIAGRRVTLAGIAKGSGMIAPNMATMLAFLLTDAAATPAFLRRALREACDASFNRVSVDGESSTSDMALLFANGVAGNPALRGPRSPGARAFRHALQRVAVALARDLARDGEGATKLIDVRVRGARSTAEAERAARRVANSLLVKTAVFGGDANWGRILQTVGAGRIALRLERAAVRLAGVTVFRNGSPTGPAARRRAAERLARPEIEIRVDLGVGRGEAQMWSCDLSHEYVRINAEYTT
ncbi:MAG: bifunctional glutamate N-acetyltransferase/amino-acid acetyltransferase ArgJ [Myxococcales bacterium]|nr:bifunctional glutamate N-acetyltransferase/amino-acid acetyltransferase ArgJ [Myxococcales bacterium]MDH5308036.1 bifunctional glutamate N-acetyltransferase/amino-acid acetyltransferase ArgJ [Myxococcales bacterium]MDH5566333.1 bifunctional glutamate N-acetyltransferase/amino-acid acetyltransferase ArgJ [Myxococcales bacterium]